MKQGIIGLEGRTSRIITLRSKKLILGLTGIVTYLGEKG